MSDASPTRAALLDLRDEQRAMHEAHVFLDEKCLLLAGEMLRQLRRHAVLREALQACHEAAMAALQAAVTRHGLEGVQLLPATEPGRAALQREASSLMGVALQQARWLPGMPRVPTAVNPSPEERACRTAFAELLAAAAPLAAVHGNLERLSQEYRRSVRRARALQDVLLPEAARDLHDIETRLEELEQEEAIAMRRRA